MCTTPTPGRDSNLPGEMQNPAEGTLQLLRTDAQLGSYYKLLLQLATSPGPAEWNVAGARSGRYAVPEMQEIATPNMKLPPPRGPHLHTQPLTCDIPVGLKISSRKGCMSLPKSRRA